MYAGTGRFFSAAARGDMSTVISMLEEGRASLTETDSYYGNSVLLWAAGGCHTELLKWLLLNGASISATNNRGETALLCAARTHSRYGPRGVLTTVQYLIGHCGSSIAEVDIDGNTCCLLLV
jgi:ankyrin repeat protein